MSTRDDDLAWLLGNAMLEAVRPVSEAAIGSGRMWRRSFAQPQPRAAAALAPAWFSAYPASVVTRPGESVLRTLADRELWRLLALMEIRAIHSGPTKLAGGLVGREFTPTVDGNFDRIGLRIDPSFGTLEDALAMRDAAGSVGSVVIDDIIPGHTGKGADWRLAELAFRDYPGLYHMVEIDERDWSLLPDVAHGKDSANLSPAQVDALEQRGYIVGRLQRTIFYEVGVKETDWSATAVVRGVDGLDRRWVYLHYFKEGQPTLNWLDPSFAAGRLVVGDALHSLDVHGARMLRLDANGFLGIERRDEGGAWSEGHPLSVTVNNLIAGLVRKAGGFTFQELNLTVDDIGRMTVGGPDLSYDFVTRPATHHALLTGDTEFLRVMLGEMRAAHIDPAALIHALQNHDELTIELVHLWTAHAEDLYGYAGEAFTGLALRDRIRDEMYRHLTGSSAPYNLPFVENGISCTSTTVAAAALGITRIDDLDADERAAIQQAHLALTMANALQPGVFALSGWDLVGALTLPPSAVRHLMTDGDTRWIHRGAYDLMGFDPGAEASVARVPIAPALYGTLPDQLEDEGSFCSQLRHLLGVRVHSRLFAARHVGTLETEAPGLLAILHELPDSEGTQVTVVNLGREAVQETIPIDGLHGGEATEMLTGATVSTRSGRLPVALEMHQGASYLLP